LDPDQYIQIPGFIPLGQDLSVTASIAFLFYLKIDQAPAPTTTATLLSYAFPAVKFFSSHPFSFLLKSKKKLF